VRIDAAEKRRRYLRDKQREHRAKDDVANCCALALVTVVEVVLMVSAERPGT
jgi:hypothetical protein